MIDASNDEVVLDGNDGRSLALRRISRRDSDAIWSYEAALTIPQATASAKVYDIGDGPASFFRDLADSWKGFEGVEEYSTLEGELSFSCSHDGLGTISCTVTLSQPWPPTWRMKAELEFGAGAHLERLALGMEAFAATSKSDG